MSLKCSECGGVRDDICHSGKYEGSHFFNLGEPLVRDRPDVRAPNIRRAVTTAESQDAVLSVLLMANRPLSTQEVADQTGRSYARIADTMTVLRGKGAIVSIDVREVRNVKPRPRTVIFKRWVPAERMQNVE